MSEAERDDDATSRSVGQFDASGIGFPCGNARAWSVDVSRQ